MSEEFRFKTLKRVRELREKEQQREYGKKQQKVQAIVKRIDGIESKKHDAIDLADRQRRELFDLQSDFLIQRYLQSLHRNKAYATVELAEADRQLQEQRQVMLKAMQERKMMDKLYEKHKEETRLDQLREDTKRLSEIAILRYGRDKQL